MDKLVRRIEIPLAKRAIEKLDYIATWLVVTLSQRGNSWV
jgi:hypothetical protein